MLQTPNKYTMRISRLTVDKLGIQMYDSVNLVPLRRPETRSSAAC